MKRLIIGKASVAAVMLTVFVGTAPAQPGDTPQLTSPERRANGDVVLRLHAPSAEKVSVVSGGDIPGVSPREGLAMSQVGEGVWSVEFADMRPGSFRYRFDVDGVRTLDPLNRHTSESAGNAWSLFHVPGHAFMDTQKVAHGAVSEVTYWSETLEQHRRMHVYTPPAYAGGEGSFPVLYLLHGAGDSDDSWSSVGRAGFILDNLIASGAAEPMIVVMPDGHPPVRAEGPRSMQLNLFAKEFATDVKPYVESHYRLRGGRDATAIAGLSMGGAQTLEIVMADLAAYGHIGVFSSGVFGINESDEWQKRHAAVLEDASLRNGLEYFWFAIGDEDFLLDTAAASVEMLRGYDFDIVYHESAGGHTWENWRQYLNQFAQAIFR